MPITYTYGEEESRPDFLETGIYPATIDEAREKKSKAGNDMIEIMWKCDNGFTIWDHLVDLPNCRWKSNQLLEAIGSLPKSGGQVLLSAENMIGWNANLKIVLIDGKNQVDGYLPITEKDKENRKDILPF